MPQAQIHYNGIEAWENNRDKVDQILQEATGTSEYPSTKSLPPITVGVEIAQDVIDKLKALEGVIVRTLEDE